MITLTGMSAGSAVTQTVMVSDAARALQSGADGTESQPAMVPASGEWSARTTGYGHTGWFQLRTRAAREFTIEARALDETGAPSDAKAQMVIGAWNGSDAAGTLPVTATVQPFNSGMPGLTALPVLTVGDSEVRIGFADFGGDGRPDFAYHGRILYADSITPSRLPVTGGQIVIRGMGFRCSMMVLVNGVSAQVTSVTPNAIVANAPAAGSVTGTVPIQIEDTQTLAMAGIANGFSYDAGGSDAIALLSGPPGTAPIGVPQPLAVRVINVDTQAPAAGVTVSFAVTQGSASLGCGQATCAVTTSGDGTAMLPVTPTAAALTQITASLANGSSVIDQFAGAASAGIVALTPNLYIAMGATVTWPVQAMVVDAAGNPVARQSVNWTGVGVRVSAGQSVTAVGGVASSQIAAGPFTASVAGTAQACIAGTQACATFQVILVQPGTEGLIAWSGTQQYIPAGQSFAPVALHVIDAFGNPLAGATVTFEEAFFGWTQPCPPQGSCPPAPLLTQAAVQARSGPDGSVVLMPLAANGLPGKLMITAVVGTSTVLNFELDAHP
ncbi:MAG TPA: IPT/TIG domain-containing protein [Acidobacteriaceae bacterium]|nr:IPT/TIG domain-containing protein [Acidobacteriaceae bacterium]